MISAQWVVAWCSRAEHVTDRAALVTEQSWSHSVSCFLQPACLNIGLCKCDLKRNRPQPNFMSDKHESLPLMLHFAHSSLLHGRADEGGMEDRRDARSALKPANPQPAPAVCMSYATAAFIPNPNSGNMQMRSECSLHRLFRPRKAHGHNSTHEASWPSTSFPSLKAAHDMCRLKLGQESDHGACRGSQLTPAGKPSMTRTDWLRHFLLCARPPCASHWGPEKLRCPSGLPEHSRQSQVMRHVWKLNMPSRGPQLTGTYT